ncbi:glycosyltransferase family 2 protein [candidate division CSSED10-310 bacterium]|uniref:Glycosyltransferase family 2 protein n=1 Tax=candidate division CSSED10-310 bacterium TaxID=2855610 RepID=A0ABV6YSX4_UNCC1
MTKPDISLFFPAYNEEGNIERVVLEAKSILEELARNFEIIIVNDGSNDDTGKIADALAAQDPRIKVCHHPLNRGYGAALKTGYTAARLEYIFFVDSDGQFDLSEMHKFMPFIADFDIVTGYRIRRQDNFVRILNARGWNIINKILFGINVKDINCAFKCIKRSVFDLFTLTTDGAMINAELYAKARIHELTIKEIGVSHYSRTIGTQTGAHLSVIIKAFRELWLIKKHL